MESLDEYLERLASKQAVPGGGSAAALVGALGAALVAMVARIGAPATGLADEADALRAQLGEARSLDEAAFSAVVAAQALPKRDDAEKAARRRVLDAALDEAARAPLHAAWLALAVLRLAERLSEESTGALASDVGCAAEFAYAAFLACAYNVRINHRYMRDETAITGQAAMLAGYDVEAEAILERLRKRLAAVLTKSGAT